MKPVLFAALCCLSLLACQKRDDAHTDASQVTVSIASPAEGQLFRSGDRIRFRATVHSPGELHGYVLNLTNAATGEALLSFDAHVHTDHIEIDTVWVPSVSATTAVLGTVRAEIDHDGTEATQDVRFSVQP